MTYTIIQIGKTKHSFIKEAETEYTKRISPFVKIKTIEIKEAGTTSVNEADRARARQKEADAILEKIPQNNIVIALDEKGKELSSQGFAKELTEYKNHSQEITFIIGGPFGLDESVRKNADLILSFSRFTFTHEMIRVLLLEQIYRAHMIIAGRTYHY